MNKTASNRLVLVLAAAGCIDALALTFEHYHPRLLPCGGPSGCAGALNSQYGQIGPVPTALFGLLMYVALIILAVRRGAVLATDGERLPPPAEPLEPVPFGLPRQPVSTSPPALTRVDTLVAMLASAGALISWWLQYVSLYELNSFCPYCFTSACLITVVALISIRDRMKDAAVITGEQRMLCIVLAFVTVMVGFMVAPDVIYRWQMTQRKQFVPTHVVGPGVKGSLQRAMILGEHRYWRGDPAAKYSLVEFADYECPACKRATGLADGLVKQRNDLRLTFRNFPLVQLHPHSKDAACAAEAAGLQGKFWEMHDMIYANQDALKPITVNTDELFAGYAAKLGLDHDRFESDTRGQVVLSRIATDMSDGTAGGVELTPTFYFVSPNNIWRFAGIEELKLALADPKHPMWN